MKNLKNKKGFTLIELIVVLAILGILMLILVPSFLGYADDAKTQVASANTRTLWTAAKAAETKTEYDTSMKVGNCVGDKDADGTNANITKFCAEITDKVGSTFAKDKITVTSGTVAGKTGAIVTAVSYESNGKTCTYTGSTSKIECN